MVVVGPQDDRCIFTIHESLGRKESAVFEAALSKDGEENESGTIYILQHRPGQFDLFVSFIYNHAIFSIKASDPRMTGLRIENRNA